MLTHLLEKATAALESAVEVTFVSCGPAGPQASIAPCTTRANPLRLAILLPRVSDHLFNLEQAEAMEVVAICANWELRGTVLLSGGGVPPWRTGSNALVQVMIQPLRLQIYRSEDRSIAETIDFNGGTHARGAV